MSRIAKQALAVSLVLSLFLGGTAMAAKVYKTSFAFGANRTSIHKGQKVVFSGTLKSKFKKCKKHRPVTLYRNGHPIDTRTTSATGQFSFKRHISKTRTWQVRFAGRSGGTHPNQFVCKASKSKKIKVHVKH